MTTSIQDWLEQRDIERSSISRGTWIPLKVSDPLDKKHRYSDTGHRIEYRSFESIVIAAEHRTDCLHLTWHEISRDWPDSALLENGVFIPPGAYYGPLLEEPYGIYPVVSQSYPTEDHPYWDLHQEITLSLGLLRKGDKWIRPSEGGLEVARLTRADCGEPIALEIHAGCLRDYLKARKSALVIGAFTIREVFDSDFPVLSWSEGIQTREFRNGEWDGAQGPTMDDDSIHHAQGRIWWAEWVEPADVSYRVADEPPPELPFIVDNQGGPLIPSSELVAHSGWVWFDPKIVRSLLANPNGFLNWSSKDTGHLGIGGEKIHFGVNPLGLLAVYAKDIGVLPYWFQKLILLHNVSPDGGIGEELYTTHVRAWFLDSTAPEKTLIGELINLNSIFEKLHGVALFKDLPQVESLHRLLHRFYSGSFDDVCLLAKELSKAINDRMSQSTIDSLLSEEKLKKANTPGSTLRSVRRLALLLDQVGKDGRIITRPLGGISDLRQGDVHPESSSLRESLKLFDISPDSEDYLGICIKMISDTAESLHQIATAFK